MQRRREILAWAAIGLVGLIDVGILFATGCTGSAWRRTISTVEVEAGHESQNIDATRQRDLGAESNWVAVSVQPFASAEMGNEAERDARLSAEMRENNRIMVDDLLRRSKIDGFEPLRTPPPARPAGELHSSVETQTAAVSPSQEWAKIAGVLIGIVMTGYGGWKARHVPRKIAEHHRAKKAQKRAKE